MATKSSNSRLFHSARLKLTIFYLAVIVAVSFSFSFTMRWLAQHEYERSTYQERGTIQEIIDQESGVQYQFQVADPYRSGPVHFDAFRALQDLHQQEIRNKLNDYLLLVNLTALVLGGLLSYWFAGRTLRPIEAAHEAQRRFAADASHELRTPLTAMRTENEVFLRQADFTKTEAREQINSNLEEVQRMEQLASNLLLLTQYEAEGLATKSLAPRALVDEAVAQVSKADPSLAKRIVLKLKATPVRGDAESVVRLICILLDNAIKYGDPQKPIEIAGTVEADRYVLRVRDYGKGIADQDLPHIFERLYRGDKAHSSQIPGSGLGLSLAQEIARVNNATVEAANHPDGGAVFTVLLALAKPPKTT